MYVIHWLLLLIPDIVALYRKRKEKEELFEKYTKKYNTIQLIDQFNKKVTQADLFLSFNHNYIRFFVLRWK